MTEATEVVPDLCTSLQWPARLFSGQPKLEIGFSLNHEGTDKKGTIFRRADGGHPARS